MRERVLVLLRARLAAQREGASVPVAALLMQAAIAGVLCGLVRDVTPPFAYAVFALTLGAALVAVPLLGELSGLLTADEAGDWLRAQPVRPREVALARLLHLLIVLAVLSLGALLPAALFAPGAMGLIARLALVAGGLGQALFLAAALLLVQAVLRGRAQPLLVLAQTALFAGVIAGAAVGLRHVPALARLPAPGSGSSGALALFPPAWFAAPAAAAEGAALPLGWALAAPACVLAAALLLVLLPPPPAAAARSGQPLLGTLLSPLRALALAWWVRRDERASFHLVYDALPKERDFVMRTYPLLAAPLALLAIGAKDGGAFGREGLLALLLFTPGAYLPILLAHVPASSSAAARWILDTAPQSRSSLDGGARKAVAVRFLAPLYILLALLCWSFGDLSLALRLALPAYLVALLVVRSTWPLIVTAPPLSTAPEELYVDLDWLGLLAGLGIALTIAAVLAAKLVDTLLAGLLVSAALIAIELAASRRT